MLKIAWSPIYAHPLPEGHRFPMEKYNLLPEQLLHEGTVSASNFFEPLPISEEQVLSIHSIDYWLKLKHNTLSPAEIRKTGFPLSQELIHRERVIMQGTVDCVDHALMHGVAMNIAGGTHHAFTDRGEGFCLLNDIGLAANHFLQSHPGEKVLVIDLDVHQGNGTAEIFKNEPRVFTFSMHGGNNYPMQKEKSDLDIPLPDGIEDKEYLELLDIHLPQLIAQVKPALILYQCGVDILSTDKLGRLGVSREGCKERDRKVLSLSKQHKIPLVASMGGGYSPRISDVLEAHANTFRLAQELFF